jgi:hypothetical protein
MIAFTTLKSRNARTNPKIGESSSDFPMLAACVQSTPLVPVRALINWLAMPTPMTASHLQDQLDRQERYDAEGYGSRRCHHPQKIPETRPNHGNMRIERMGINDRSDSVGRAVKAIHELKAQRN